MNAKRIMTGFTLAVMMVFLTACTAVIESKALPDSTDSNPAQTEQDADNNSPDNSDNPAQENEDDAPGNSDEESVDDSNGSTVEDEIETTPETIPEKTPEQEPGEEAEKDEPADDPAEPENKPEGPANDPVENNPDDATVGNPPIDGFVGVSSTQIIDGQGEPIFFSGINLGNWLLWEGYLMMGDFNYRTHSQFLESLTTVFGSEQKAKVFEHQWRLNYVDDKAIADLASLGFNSVRVPFHYNMFWQNNQVSDHGFQYFNQVIEAARNHGVYVLLDMHAAPGYQNPGDHADNINSNASQPRDTVEFWDGTENIATAAKVWQHIAAYYKDEPVIWGYDLFNEPVPQPKRELELLPSLIKIRDAIREVDTNHIIVAEGSWWSSDLTKIDWADPIVQEATGVDSQWEDKLVYQIHHYGSAEGTFGREDITNNLNIPLIIGEYGESDNNNLKKITDWSKQELAGYFPWSFKKMSHDKTLWTIKPNADYEQLKTHIKNNTRGPDALFDAMIKFAQNNIRNGVQGLEWHQGFYDAVKPGAVGEGDSEGDNDQNGSTIAQCDSMDAATELPAKIEAESFCASNGIQLEATADTGAGENVGWTDSGDWLDYRVSVPETGTYRLTTRVASEGGSTGFKVIASDSELVTVAVPDTEGWQNWQSLESEISLTQGTHIVRLEFIDRGINLNWFEISQVK